MAYLGGGTNTADTSATTITCAYSPSVTAGSLLVLYVDWEGAGAGVISSVTDTAGNTWAVIGSRTTQAADGQDCQMAYAMNANAGATTVTVTFAATAAYRRIAVGEWSGQATSAALDVQAGQAGTNTTAANNATSGSVLPTTNGQLIVGAFANTNSGSVTTTAGTGFTKRVSGAVIALEDQTQATAAAISATWTIGTAGNYVAKVATFKPAAAPSNFIQPIRRRPASGLIMRGRR